MKVYLSSSIPFYTQMILLGIKQLSSSIGITSSHIHTMPPSPLFNEVLSITEYFFTSLLSGLADFFISIGCIMSFSSINISISLAFESL